jgi:hypothetical protein
VIKMAGSEPLESLFASENEIIGGDEVEGEGGEKGTGVGDIFNAAVRRLAIVTAVGCTRGSVLSKRLTNRHDFYGQLPQTLLIK